MFSERDFLMKGFLEAVGNQPDYWIRLNAHGYAEKGLLTQSDLDEIDKAINRKNQPVVAATDAVDVAEETGDGETEPEEENPNNGDGAENP